MLHLRLVGGLGNQLFQLAAALRLSKYYELPICIWVGALQKYAVPRELSLNAILYLDDLSVIIDNKKNFVLRSRFARVFSGRIGTTLFVNDSNYVKQLPSKDIIKTVYVDGYFIESINQALFNETAGLIQPFLRNSVSQIHFKSICVIHIRGGDFIKLGWAPNGLDLFYKQAVEQVLQKSPLIKFVVVTDDKVYAANLLDRIGVIAVVQQGTIEEDFNLIRSAGQAIISNSTFAFWAATFRENVDGKSSTIVPTVWRPGVSRQLKLHSE